MHPIIYDKAKYHFGSENFPKSLPKEQAFVHTGMFLGWVIENNLYNEQFIKELGAENSIDEFKKQKLTGTKFFERVLGGVFTDESLSAEGNSFAQYYFDFENGKYLKDYSQTLTAGLPSMYHVEDTWDNYKKLKDKIDERYSEWKTKKINTTILKQVN